MTRLFYRPAKTGLVFSILVGQMLNVIGLPASWFAPWVSKDRSIPFPCMNHGCSCRNAYECWTSCCCFTPSQRLEWARQHGLMNAVPLIAQADTCSSGDCRSCVHAAAEQGCQSCGFCTDENSVAEDLQAQEWWHPILVQRCRGEVPGTLPNWLALAYWPNVKPIRMFAFPGHPLTWPDDKRPIGSTEVPKPPPRS